MFRLRQITLPGTSLLVLTGVLALAPTASATDFCVPNTSIAGCPAGATGSTLPNAMKPSANTTGDDGIPDRIFVGAGVVTHNDTYELESGDADDLEITGAGPDATFVTSSDNGNQFVINLNGAREVTVRDLTVRVPASFAGGSGVQAEGGSFDNVDIEVRSSGGDGMSVIGGTTFRYGRMYASNGGSLEDGFRTNGAQSGTLEIQDTVIDNPSWGVDANSGAVVTWIRRSRIISPTAYGVRVSGTGIANIRNSIIETDDQAYAVIGEATTTGPVLPSMRHVTLVGTNMDPGRAAISSIVSGAGTGSVNFVASDLIIDGYDVAAERESVGPGSASLALSYSHFPNSILSSGPGTLSVSGVTNIDALVTPVVFSDTDYRVPSTAASIDKGTPPPLDASGWPSDDFLGALRPVDGDGDGIARRDMGAYEYQPPNPPANPGTNPPGGNPSPDSAPVIQALKFAKKVSYRKGGRFSVTLSEASKLELTFQRKVKKGKKKPKAKVLTYDAKADANSFKIKKRKLKAGKYRVSALATDAAGNKSKPVTAKLTVKRR